MRACKASLEVRIAEDHPQRAGRPVLATREGGLNPGAALLDEFRRADYGCMFASVVGILRRLSVTRDAPSSSTSPASPAAPVMPASPQPNPESCFCPTSVADDPARFQASVCQADSRDGATSSPPICTRPAPGREVGRGLPGGCLRRRDEFPTDLHQARAGREVGRGLVGGDLRRRNQIATDLHGRGRRGGNRKGRRENTHEDPAEAPLPMTIHFLPPLVLNLCATRRIWTFASSRQMRSG